MRIALMVLSLCTLALAGCGGTITRQSPSPLSVSAQTLDFGSARAEAAPLLADPRRTLTLTNTSSQQISISASVQQGTSFSLSGVSAALCTWQSALYGASSQAVRIQILGDSESRCDQQLCGNSGSIPGDRWPEQLRNVLQGSFGSHGTGRVPLLFSVANQTKVNSDNWTIFGPWTTDATIGPSQSGPFPGSGLIKASVGTVAVFSSPIAYDTLGIYCMETPLSHGWSVSHAMSRTGGMAPALGTICDASAATARAAYESFALPSGPSVQMVALTCTGTPCYLYAAEGLAGSTGVSIDNDSAAYAETDFWGDRPAQSLAFSDLAPGGTQLAIVFLGPNDMLDEPFTPAAVAKLSTNLSAIVAHLQSQPQPPSILLMVPPVSLAGSAAAWPAYTAAIASVAAAQSTGLLNIQAITGPVPNCSSSFWADPVECLHPGDLGQQELAGWVQAAILASAPAAQCSTLAPAASCTLAVRFAPATLGPQTGTLTLTTGTSQPAQTITLTGTGIQ